MKKYTCTFSVKRYRGVSLNEIRSTRYYKTYSELYSRDFDKIIEKLKRERRSETGGRRQN